LIIFVDLLDWWWFVGLVYGAIFEDSKCWLIIFERKNEMDKKSCHKFDRYCKLDSKCRINVEMLKIECFRFRFLLIT